MPTVYTRGKKKVLPDETPVTTPKTETKPPPEKTDGRKSAEGK